MDGHVTSGLVNLHNPMCFILLFRYNNISVTPTD